MPSFRKKVIVRTLDHSIVSGYLPPSRFVGGPPAMPSVDLLDLEGRIQAIPLSTIRSVAFVRDFNLGQPNPENLERRTFLARPRSEGLWVRVTLHAWGGSVEVFEGLAPLDLALLDDLLEDRGLLLIPPDVRSNTQRLYLPRTAIRSVEVIAVITTRSKVKPIPAPEESLQEPLFGDPPQL